MKTVLIATDFSAAARSASEYGLQLARAFNARVILFSAYLPVPRPVTDPAFRIPPEELREPTLRALDREMLTLAAGNGLSIKTSCDEGIAETAILKAARQEKADLIIAGMKSTGRGLRKIFGTTVTALARESSIPVIIVPEGVKYVNPVTIALASDIAPETDMQTLNALREVGSRFQSKLYIVRIIKDSTQQVYEILNRPARLSKMVRSLDAEYRFPESKTIPDGLNDFIKSFHINMLAMVPHKHSLLERWFIKSNTHSMIFTTTIPLLILPEIHTLPENPAQEAIRVHEYFE